MKLDGCTDLVLELLESSRVSITIRFKTPMKAQDAFEALRKKSLGEHELELKLTLGERVPEH